MLCHAEVLSIPRGNKNYLKQIPSLTPDFDRAMNTSMKWPLLQRG